MQSIELAMITAKYATNRMPQGRAYLQQYVSQHFSSKNEFWLLRGNERDGEEELYVNENYVLKCCLTETPDSPFIKVMLTLKTRVAAACFATFELPRQLNPTSASLGTATNSLQHGIAAFEQDCLTYFTDDGDELRCKLPCPVSAVWPLEKCILLEGNIPEKSHTGLCLYAITHPLDEISPVYFRVPDNQGEWKSYFCMDGHLRIVDANPNPSIVSMININTGKHSLWLLRSAEPHEYQSLFTMSQGEYILAPSVYTDCSGLGCTYRPSAYVTSMFTHKYSTQSPMVGLDSFSHADLPYNHLFFTPLQKSRVAQLQLDERRRNSLPLNSQKLDSPLFAPHNVHTFGHNQTVRSSNLSVPNSTVGGQTTEMSPAVNSFVDTLNRLKATSRQNESNVTNMSSKIPILDGQEYHSSVLSCHPTGNEGEILKSIAEITVNKCPPTLLPEGEPLHPAVCLQLIWSEEMLPTPRTVGASDNVFTRSQKQNVMSLRSLPECNELINCSSQMEGLNVHEMNTPIGKGIEPAGGGSMVGTHQPWYHHSTVDVQSPKFQSTPMRCNAQPQPAAYPQSEHPTEASQIHVPRNKPPQGAWPRKGFIAKEILDAHNQRLWAAYLQEDSSPPGRRLVLHLLESKDNHYRCKELVKLPVKDAVYLDELNIILVLNTQDHLILYSGIKKICHLGVTPPPMHFPKKVITQLKQSLPLNIMDFANSNMKSDRGGGSGSSIKHMDFMPPPLPPHQCKATYALSEATGKAFSLTVTDPNSAEPLMIRFYLKDLAQNELVKRCIKALSHILPESVCHEFLIRWYADNNAPGRKVIVISEEWNNFVHLLYNAIGLKCEESDDDVRSMERADCSAMDQPMKRCRDQSKEEWIASMTQKVKLQEWQTCLKLMKVPAIDFPASFAWKPADVSSTAMIASGFLRPDCEEEYALDHDVAVNLLYHRELHVVHSYGAHKVPSMPASPLLSLVNRKEVTLVWKSMSATTTLQDYIADIMVVFHLIYEDMKLNRLYVQNRRQLAQLNLTLSIILQWQGYIDSYLREHPSLLQWFNRCRPLQQSSISSKLSRTRPNFCHWTGFDPLRPPIVSGRMTSLFQMLPNQLPSILAWSPFPILPASLTDNIEMALQSVNLLKRFTHPDWPASQLKMVQHIVPSDTVEDVCLSMEEEETTTVAAAPTSVYENFVAYLSQLSEEKRTGRRHWFSNLSSGLKLLISTALTYCQEDPPPNCSLSLYRLLDRTDFTAQIELHGTETEKAPSSSTLVVVDHWYQKVQPFLAMPLIVEKLRKNDFTLNPTLIMQLEADVAVQFAFREDLRLREAGRLLICPTHYELHLAEHVSINNQNIAQINDEASWSLLAHAFCASSMPVGRGMLLIGSHQSTQSPGIVLSTLSHGNQTGAAANFARPGMFANISGNTAAGAAATAATAAASSSTIHLADSLATPPHLVPMHVSIKGYLANANSTMGLGTRYTLTPADQVHVLRRYPAYHMGVAEAARFASHIELNTAWLFNDRPEADSTQEAERAGMILGLGLVGHLDKLSLFNISQYLTRKYDMSNMAILLSLCARKRRSGDNTLMRILAVHFRPMLPAASIELEPLNLCHSAAMLGLGMLYESTGSLHITQIMLNEIASPVCVEDEEGRVSVSREALGLAAGFSLGLIMFQKATDKVIVNVLGNQISLMQQLHALMTGAQRQIPHQYNPYGAEDCPHLSNGQQTVILEDIPDVVGANLHFYLSVGGEASPVMGGYEGLDRGVVGGPMTGAAHVAVVSGMDANYGDILGTGSAIHQHYRRRYVYGDARIGREGRSRRFHAKIMEGDRYNVDVSSSGAIVALGLAFFDATARSVPGASVVQSWLSCPTSCAQLSYVRPHHLRLQAIAHGLVTWSEIQPSHDWLSALIPSYLHRFAPPGFLPPVDYKDIHVDFENLSLCEMDEEGMRSSCLHFISGCLFVMSMKYAGTHNLKAYKFLMHWCKAFLLDPALQAPTVSDPLTHHPPRLLSVSLTKWNEAISLLLLSIAMVMSGSGNLKILRLIRIFRSRLFHQLVRSIRRRRLRPTVGANGLPPPPQPLNITNSWLNEAHFGSFQFVHMALGLLFLGAGRLTLSNRPEDIPILLMAFYPDFAQNSDDQAFYLQALRNLYLLAVKPGRLTAIDYDTQKPVDSSIVILPKSLLKTDTTEEISWRSVLPSSDPSVLDLVAMVEIHAHNYWTMKFRPGSKEWKLVQDSFYKGGYIYMKRRQPSNCIKSIFLDAQQLLGSWLQPYIAEQLSVFACGVKHCLPSTVDVDHTMPTAEAQEISTFMISRFIAFKNELNELFRIYFSQPDSVTYSPLLSAFLLWFQIYYREDLRKSIALQKLVDRSLSDRSQFLQLCIKYPQEELSITCLYSLFLYLSPLAMVATSGN